MRFEVCEWILKIGQNKYFIFKMSFYLRFKFSGHSAGSEFMAIFSKTLDILGFWYINPHMQAKVPHWKFAKSRFPLSSVPSNSVTILQKPAQSDFMEINGARSFLPSPEVFIEGNRNYNKYIFFFLRVIQKLCFYIKLILQQNFTTLRNLL